MGLVGRYPYQLPDGPQALLRAPCGFPPEGAYAGLAPLSRRYPPRVDRSPTCSSAVRHSRTEARAFDLHALGTPPAFILSQDQTLRCWFAPLSGRMTMNLSLFTWKGAEETKN